jgi:hypothetical protein
MTAPDAKILRKWWLQGIVILVATSPPAIVMLLQDILLPYLAILPPAVVLRIGAALLLTTTALLAYFFLQRLWLKWDELTGTWLSRFTGHRYCGSCRAKKVIVPLKNMVTGWHCVACDKFHPDPARRPMAVKPAVIVKRINNVRDW